LQNAPVLYCFALGSQVLERLNEEPPGTTGGVEDRLTKPGVCCLHHELNDRSRGVELAGITCCVSHLSQHGFI
jgi:hypothetical protein